MPIIISVINLKGGVAKTTTVVQLAETLAFIGQKRVLVIDLDPQTNATIALAGEDRWLQADDEGQTLAQLFLDRLHGTDVFDMDRAVIRAVSNINRLPYDVVSTLGLSERYPRIDLLPSSIRLIDVIDRMGEIAGKTHFTTSPMEVVKHALGDRLHDYDVVLIDCPPNLGYITQNGIELSDWYVIPTIADRLSTYGIPQIVKSIHTFRVARRLRIRPLGVIVTKFQANSATHKSVLKQLPEQIHAAFEAVGETPAPIFRTLLPQANATAEAMNFEREVASFKDKYGRGRSGEQYLYEFPIALMEELLNHVEAQSPAVR